MQSLRTIAGAGEPQMKTGLAIHSYVFDVDMHTQTSFYNSDGDLLLLPITGVLDVVTEFGKMMVGPGDVCVLPRGVKFSVSRFGDTSSAAATGYVLETFSALHFTLPDLGPIGANGLANPRDFKYPTAWIDSTTSPSSSSTSSGSFTLINKFLGRGFVAKQDTSPYDVPAWHGNYLPYKYSLHDFSPVGSVGFDHPDPSIFTVLSLPNPATPGTALADLVVFPPRWLVAESTFRPPYFHRNVMSEFMINVLGEYDGKEGGGFGRGAASLHGMNAAHGPDKVTFDKETRERPEGPKKVGEGSLAVMFESSAQLVTTRWAVEGGERQRGYHEVWSGFEAGFELK